MSEPDAEDSTSFNTYNTVQNIQADQDGDGMAGWAEILAGTDPAITGSVLSFKESVPLGGGDFSVSWSSAGGRTYSLTVSTNLITGQWQILVSNLSANPPTNSYTISPSSPMFYRIKVE